MELTKDELMYIRNLIKTSGDLGYSFKIGNMVNMINCNDLFNKIAEVLENV